MSSGRGILGYAMNMIQQNPQVRNNPEFAEMINAIERGDAQTGQALANKVLQQNGVTKEQGLSLAFQKLNFPKF